MFLTRVVLFFEVLCFVAFQTNGNEVLVLQKNQKYPLIKYISYYEDTTNTLTFDKISELYNSGKFQKDKKIGMFNPLITYWIEFEAINNTSDQSFLVFNAKAPVSHLEVYANTNGNISVLKNESVNNDHKIKIFCPSIPGLTTRYFIKVYQKSILSFDLSDSYLSTREIFVKEVITQSVLTGLIVGILILMFVYNFFRYLFRKKKVYLYYILYVLFSIIFIIQGSYLQEYVFSPINNFRLIWIYTSLPISDVFYIVFIREFIEPQYIPSRIDNYFYKPFIVFVVISNLFLGYLALTNTFEFTKFYYLIPPVYALIGLVLAVVLIVYVKKPEAIYALIGNSIAIVSGIASISLDNKLFLENNHIFNVGLVSDIFFFTYALSLKEKREDDFSQKNKMDIAMMKMTLEVKQRELTAKAFQVVRQGEMILKVKNIILEIKSKMGHLNSDLLNLLSEVELYLKQNDWDDFEIYFKEVHPNFYLNLLNKYPSLTQYDLRICALIKLNMSTKQIANVFRKTPKSIEVARTRIRHKMQINSDETLFAAISNIPS